MLRRGVVVKTLSTFYTKIENPTTPSAEAAATPPFLRRGVFVEYIFALVLNKGLNNYFGGLPSS